MKLSTRSTYGLRAMLGLAIAYETGSVILRELAESQRLPPTYLEQLMIPLRKAGLVSASRGVHGGHSLARPPAEITIAEIVEVLEGPLQLVECTSVASCCWQPEACALKDLLDEAGEAMLAVLRRTTLADLAQRQRAKESTTAPMYAI